MKKEKHNYHTVYVDYQTITDVIEDTLDYDGPYTGRCESSSSHSINGLVEEENREFGSEMVPLISEHQKLREGKNYFILYAIYSTGDSFSSDEDGGIEFIAAFSNRNLAKENKERLKKHHEAVCNWNGNYTSRSKKKNEKLKKVTPHLTTILGHDHQAIELHIPWHGYFERLTSINIKTVWKID